MKAAPRYPRWAISFADLTLLLLCFSVMFQMMASRGKGEMPRPFAEAAAPEPLLESEAAPLFEIGEARLTPLSRARLNKIGHDAATRHRELEVRSLGSAPGGARFDRWELTAARAAAIARALAEGGIRQDRIDLAIPSLDRQQSGQPQRILVRSL